MTDRKVTLHVAFGRDPRLKGKNGKDNYTSNHSINERMRDYAQLKAQGYHVKIIIYPLTFQEYQSLYSELKTTQLIERYILMEAPIQSIDCDEFEIVEPTTSLWDEATESIKNAKDPQIVEILDKKIEMVGELQRLMLDHIINYVEFNTLVTAVLYYNLGKLWMDALQPIPYINQNHYKNLSNLILITNSSKQQKVFQELSENPKETLNSISKIIQLQSNDQFDKNVVLTNREKELLSIFTKIINKDD